MRTDTDTPTQTVMQTLKKPWLAKWGEGEPLCEGGQGETFAVPNRATPKGVLKLILEKHKQNPKARARMSAEVNNLRMMKSCGAKVPQVLEANPENISDLQTELYFVMEFIPGQTLDKLITAHGGLSFEESVKVCLALAETLRIAVDIPIIHRDLKPENVMVRKLETFDIVILDFGISFHVNNGSNLTEADEPFRNKLIQLPERTGYGENKRDPRSDVTDVAAILYYCLTEQPPMNLEDSSGNPIHYTVQSKLRQKCSDEIQLRKINTFFAKGFQRDIDKRFQSVDELENRLRELLNPGAPASNEDLQSILNHAAEILLEQDSKTRVFNFRTNIKQSVQTFEGNLDGLAVAVVRKLPGLFGFSPLALSHSFPNKNKDHQFVLIMENIADLAFKNFSYEGIYLYPLAVQNIANNRTLLIQYEFQLEGNECVVYRTIFQQDGNVRTDIEGRKSVERFAQPDEATLVNLIPDVEEAVKICIAMIMKTIM